MFRIVAPLAVVFLMIFPPVKSPAGIPDSFPDPPWRDDHPLWSQALAHWERRADSGHARKTLDTFLDLAEIRPGDPAVELWLCRVSYFVGLRETDSEKRTRLLREAVDRGKKVLARDPENVYALYWITASYYHFKDIDSIPPEVRKLAGLLPRGKELPLPAELSPSWHTALRHWDARDDLDRAWRAAFSLEREIIVHPDSFEAWAWLSRMYYWLGRNGETRKEQAQVFHRGYEYGMMAVNLKPRHAGANFWTVSNLARYGERGTILRKAKLARRIIDFLRVIDQEEPLYYHSGLLRLVVFAIADVGFITRKLVPVLMGIPDDIERPLALSFVIEPDYFDTRLGLAEYALSVGDLALAREQLHYVIATPPGALPGYEPENTLMQEFAKELMRKIPSP